MAKTAAKSMGLVLLLSLGFVLGYLFAQHPQANTISSEEAGDVFRALMRLSSAKIPAKAYSCEISGRGRAQPVLLGEFTSEYLSWTLRRDKNSRQDLQCEGGEVRRCTWSFGESKASEAWGRVLEFEYQQTTKSIRPDSLSCLDVP